MITETTITDDNDGGGDDTPGFHLLVMSPEVFWSQRLPAFGVVTVGRSSKCVVQIEDAMASREHARIHVGSEGGVPVLTIEDTGSANGTRVRDEVVKRGEPAAVLPGEAIMIGSTVLMVLQDRPPVGHRRIWSHAYFEARVEEECARAAQTRATFALGRIRFTGAAPWARVTPVLARDLTAPHVFASYGPKDYEILFVGTQAGEAEALVGKLVEASRAAGLEAQASVAWHPKDGRTADALLAAANAALKEAADKDKGEGKDEGKGKGKGISGTGAADPATSETSGMQRVRAMAARAAPSNINVLILGESGVGKDVLARLIHQLSPRAGKPFVALNCASLPASLMESELFGHEKSSFTGATAAKVGLFESANGGTVFLDEIGEMPPTMQAKLLQAIEMHEVRPVGALRSRPIDVRFVSATNVNIETAVAQGTFRSDLMYRLNTLTLAVPPLRDRKDEIAGLVATFVAQACGEMEGAGQATVSPEAMDILRQYSWPGNIRELKNVIERALLLCDGSEILPGHLPLEKMRPAGEYAGSGDGGAGVVGESRRIRKTMPPLGDPEAEAQRQKILDALEACVWSQTRAAALLGISRRTLVSKLDQYGIPRPQKRRREEEADGANGGAGIGGPGETPET